MNILERGWIALLSMGGVCNSLLKCINKLSHGLTERDEASTSPGAFFLLLLIFEINMDLMLLDHFICLMLSANIHLCLF